MWSSTCTPARPERINAKGAFFSWFRHVFHRTETSFCLSYARNWHKLHMQRGCAVVIWMCCKSNPFGQGQKFDCLKFHVGTRQISFLVKIVSSLSSFFLRFHRKLLVLRLVGAQYGSWYDSPISAASTRRILIVVVRDVSMPNCLLSAFTSSLHTKKMLVKRIRQ